MVIKTAEPGYKYFYSYAFLDRSPHASPSKVAYAAQLQLGRRNQQQSNIFSNIKAVHKKKIQ